MIEHKTRHYIFLINNLIIQNPFFAIQYLFYRINHIFFTIPFKFPIKKYNLADEINAKYGYKDRARKNGNFYKSGIGIN